MMKRFVTSKNYKQNKWKCILLAVFYIKWRYFFSLMDYLLKFHTNFADRLWNFKSMSQSSTKLSAIGQSPFSSKESPLHVEEAITVLSQISAESLSQFRTEPVKRCIICSKAASGTHKWKSCVYFCSRNL